ncbi:MAG: hypothetical protein RI897_2706 [Verrucomicrobiota bacterium]
MEESGFESQVLDAVERDIAFLSGEEALSGDEFSVFDAVGEGEVADEAIEEAEAEDGEEEGGDAGVTGGDDEDGGDEEAAEDSGGGDEESEWVEAVFRGGWGWVCGGQRRGLGCGWYGGIRLHHRLLG